MIQAAYATGTLSYIPFIRVLSRSFLQHHPDFRFFYLSIDGYPPEGELGNEPFEIVSIFDLKIPEIYSFLFRYDCLEVSTGVKPFFAEYLIRNRGVEKLIFFDADILVLSRLQEVIDLLDKYDFIVAPHILEPVPADGKRPAMPDYSLAGTFNLGFFACSNRAPALRVLRLWQDLLLQYCYLRVNEGMQVDQKWMDFVPSFCDNYAILKHPGYDVAYWNMHERRLSLRGRKYLVNGRPLRFFHFSGISLGNLDCFSIHQNRYRLSDFSELKELFRDYADRILAADHSEFREKYSYSFDNFENKLQISSIMREAYRKAWEASGEIWGNPFLVGKGTFLEWLLQRDGESLLTRFEQELLAHLERKGMVRSFNRWGDLDCFYKVVIQYQKELRIGHEQIEIMKRKRDDLLGMEGGVNIFIATSEWRGAHRERIDAVMSGIQVKKSIIHWTQGAAVWAKAAPYQTSLYCMSVEMFQVFRSQAASETSGARYEIILLPPGSKSAEVPSELDEIWIGTKTYLNRLEVASTAPSLDLTNCVSSNRHSDHQKTARLIESRLDTLLRTGAVQRTILGKPLPARIEGKVLSPEASSLADALRGRAVKNILVLYTAREDRIAAVISALRSINSNARIEAFGRESAPLKGMVETYHTYQKPGFYEWQKIEPHIQEAMQKACFDLVIVPYFNVDGAGYDNIYEILERMGVHLALGVGISNRVHSIPIGLNVNAGENFRLQTVFSRIYDEGRWKSGSGRGSGEGSHPQNTREYRQFLQQFLRQYQIRSVLDLGCGDWQSSRLIDWTGIDYIGYDVVDSIIQANRRRHAAPNIRFYTKDFSQSELPNADLVIVKDVLQHWSNQRIQDFLPKLRKYRYALVINCSFESPYLNQDIPDGEFRPIDLLREPFNTIGKIVFRFHTDKSKFPDGFKHKHVVLLRGKPQGRRGRSGVNIAGYLSAENGVGESARTMVESMTASGVPFALVNSNVIHIRQQETAYASAYSKKNPYNINLMIINADQMEVFGKEVGADFFRNKYNIGYWAWELSDFGDRWQNSFRLVDEVWVPSSFTARAVEEKTGLPVKVVPHCIRNAEPRRKVYTRRHFGIPERDYVFLFMFDFLSWFERKNPLGTIRAFKKAFHPKENARLIIKCINRGSDQQNYVAMLEEAAGHRVHFINDYLDRREINSLVQACDCYVSLHRSEGFGITLLEAMASGKPVIASAYSGNVDFMDEENSYPVRCTLKKLERNVGPYPKDRVWAHPDENHAAELMRFVFEHQDKSRAVGKLARSGVKKRLRPEAVGQIVAKRISEIEALVNAI